MSLMSLRMDPILLGLGGDGRGMGPTHPTLGGGGKGMGPMFLALYSRARWAVWCSDFTDD